MTYIWSYNIHSWWSSAYYSVFSLCFPMFNGFPHSFPVKASIFPSWFSHPDLWCTTKPKDSDGKIEAESAGTRIYQNRNLKKWWTSHKSIKMTLNRNLNFLMDCQRMLEQWLWSFLMDMNDMDLKKNLWVSKMVQSLSKIIYPLGFIKHAGKFPSSCDDFLISMAMSGSSQQHFPMGFPKPCSVPGIRHVPLPRKVFRDPRLRVWFAW